MGKSKCMDMDIHWSSTHATSADIFHIPFHLATLDLTAEDPGCKPLTFPGYNTVMIGNHYTWSVFSFGVGSRTGRASLWAAKANAQSSSFLEEVLSPLPVCANILSIRELSNV